MLVRQTFHEEYKSCRANPPTIRQMGYVVLEESCWQIMETMGRILFSRWCQSIMFFEWHRKTNSKRQHPSWLHNVLSLVCSSDGRSLSHNNQIMYWENFMRFQSERAYTGYQYPLQLCETIESTYHDRSSSELASSRILRHWSRKLPCVYNSDVVGRRKLENAVPMLMLKELS